MLTPEEFAKRMQQLSNGERGEGLFPMGAEDIHREMDSLMCNLLDSLGYTEGVEIFKNTHKWYA